MQRLDVFVLILAGLVILAGPVMALQELAKARDQEARGALIDPSATPGDLDIGFRVVWRSVMLVLTLLLDIVGCFVMLRIARQPRVRAVSGRLLGLLVLGLAWQDLAFLLDNRYLVASPYALRALIVSWLYPIGAIFVAGSVFRLGDVEALLGVPAPTSPRPGNAQ